MEKRNWKIIYTSYEGMEKKAVELVSKEMGAMILREKDIYTIYVLPCEQVKNAAVDKNAVVIGLYDENEIIRRYIKKDEIKKDGYVVKVMDNPENTELKLVLITANDAQSLYYGAVDFVDDYLSDATPVDHRPIRIYGEMFDFKLPDYYNSSAPKVKKRTVFTWGHPINDYKNYIENMARLKLNQVIIWNDFIPINSKEIVEYAHEYGIEVIWGFAWGWSTNCNNIDLDALDKLAEDIVKQYENEYLGMGDGIYFQSFTELNADKIGDRLISEVVADFVNVVSGKLLEKYPDLFIQFGLHATSVKDHLEFIAKVDKRVEIIWENCGAFPYWGDPLVVNDEHFEKTIEFNDKIIALRKEGSFGMLFKGFLTLDWIDRFAHQEGPFILGMANDTLIEKDREMVKPMWRYFQTGYMKNGEYAYRMAKHIADNAPEVTLGMAGQFAGGIWFAEALCAQIFWECDKPYDEIFEKVSKRRSVEIV